MKTKHLVNIMNRFTSDNVIRTDDSVHKDYLEIATWLKLTNHGSNEDESSGNPLVILLLKFTDSQGQKTVLIDETPLSVSKSDALLSGTRMIKSVGQITQMDLFVKNLPENIKLSPESIHINAA